MKRILTIWILFICLIVGAVWEQIYLTNSLNKLEEKTLSLEKTIQLDFNSNSSLKETEELEAFWIEHEKVLCLIINYKEIKDIITQIATLKQTIIQGDQENTFIELEKLKSYVTGTKNVIGFNIQNVF